MSINNKGKELAKSKYALQNICEFFDTKTLFKKIRLVSRTFDAAVLETQRLQYADQRDKLEKLKLSLKEEEKNTDTELYDQIKAAREKNSQDLQYAQIPIIEFNSFDFVDKALRDYREVVTLQHNASMFGGNEAKEYLKKKSALYNLMEEQEMYWYVLVDFTNLFTNFIDVEKYRKLPTRRMHALFTNGVMYSKQDQKFYQLIDLEKIHCILFSLFSYKKEGLLIGQIKAFLKDRDLSKCIVTNHYHKESTTPDEHGVKHTAPKFHKLINTVKIFQKYAQEDIKLFNQMPVELARQKVKKQDDMVQNLWYLRDDAVLFQNQQRLKEQKENRKCGLELIKEANKLKELSLLFS